MRLMIGILCVTVVTACATVEITPQGKQVAIVKDLPGGPRAYEEVKMVSCSEGMNGRRPMTNLVSCRNAVRNQAAALGADLIVIEHEQIDAGCPNCVNVVGTADRTKTPK